MLRLSTCAIIALAMAACTVDGHASEPATSPQMARIQRACSVDMGLSPSEAPYDSCVASLRQTLDNIAQRNSIANGRESCAERGLKPGTPAFATCVLETEQSL